MYFFFLIKYTKGFSPPHSLVPFPLPFSFPSSSGCLSSLWATQQGLGTRLQALRGLSPNFVLGTTAYVGPSFLFSLPETLMDTEEKCLTSQACLDSVDPVKVAININHCGRISHSPASALRVSPNPHFIFCSQRTASASARKNKTSLKNH